MDSKQFISLLELKENLLECPVCTIEYDVKENVPLLLPCFHTFCKQCVNKLCKNRGVICPLCNIKHHLRDKDVGILPKDRTRCTLLELIEKESTNSVSCTKCGTIFTVKMCCEKCDSGASDKSICSIEGHENNKLIYFCRSLQCVTNCCSHCVILDHRDSTHDILSIEEWVAHRKTLMENSESIIKQKVAEAKTMKDILQTNLSRVDDKCRSVIESITKPDHVCKKEETFLLKTEVRQKGNLCKYDLRQNIEIVTQFIDNATECCRISRETRNLSATDFLSCEKTLLNRMTDFENSTMNDKNLEIDVYFKDISDEIRNHNKRVWIKLMFLYMYNYCRSSNFRSGKVLTNSAVFVMILLILAILTWSSVTQIQQEVQLNNKARFSSRNSRGCISNYHKGFYSDPYLYNLRCVNEKRPYKYNGVFGNRTVDILQPQSLHVKIKLHIERLPNDFTTVAEFGLTNSTVGSRYILHNKNVHAVGWIIVVDNGKRTAFANRDGVILLSFTSDQYPADFTVNVKIIVQRDRRISLYDVYGQRYLDSQAPPTDDKTTQLNAFFALHPSEDINATIRSLIPDFSFDIATSFPNLFFSSDKYSVRNYLWKQSDVANNDDFFVGISKPMFCKDICVLTLEFLYSSKKDHSKKTTSAIGIVNDKIRSRDEVVNEMFHTGGQFLHFVLCNQRYGMGFFSMLSYCATVLNSGKLIPIAEDQWNILHIFIAGNSMHVRINNEVQFQMNELSSTSFKIASVSQEPSSLYVEFLGNHTVLDDIILYPNLARYFLSNLINTYPVATVLALIAFHLYWDEH